MNLEPLYEIQAGLKERIGYKQEDKFEKMMLALLVEVGECANEYRAWKYWSTDQKSRTWKREACPVCNAHGGPYRLYQDGSEPPEEFCEKCAGYKCVDTNPLLEEYVDGLHFVLEAGLALLEQEAMIALLKRIDVIHVNVTEKDIVKQFKSIKLDALLLEDEVDYGVNFVDKDYCGLVEKYLILGAMLGFTEEQIETAYLEKNKENHDRQNRGY